MSEPNIYPNNGQAITKQFLRTKNCVFRHHEIMTARRVWIGNIGRLVFFSDGEAENFVEL